MNTEDAGSTTSLFCAHLSDLISGRQVGLWSPRFHAGYDHEIDIRLFARVARQQWTNKAFVVRVREHCQNGTIALVLHCRRCEDDAAEAQQIKDTSVHWVTPSVMA